MTPELASVRTPLTFVAPSNRADHVASPLALSVMGAASRLAVAALPVIEAGSSPAAFSLSSLFAVGVVTASLACSASVMP